MVPRWATRKIDIEPFVHHLLAMKVAGFTSPQYKFASNTTRLLKKHKNAGPFLSPVDPVALGIPHYSTIITKPMDLGTVERRLFATVPGKVPNVDDDSSSMSAYTSVEEWIADVNQVFQNSYRFNGVEHPISKMAETLEKAFKKELKRMPSADDKGLSVSYLGSHVRGRVTQANLASRLQYLLQTRHSADQDQLLLLGPTTTDLKHRHLISKPTLPFPLLEANLPNSWPSNSAIATKCSITCTRMSIDNLSGGSITQFVSRPYRTHLPRSLIIRTNRGNRYSRLSRYYQEAYEPASYEGQVGRQRVHRSIRFQGRLRPDRLELQQIQSSRKCSASLCQTDEGFV